MNQTGTIRKARGKTSGAAGKGPAGALPEKIWEYAQAAPERLRQISDDPETPAKLRADIERWFYETVFGKSSQARSQEGAQESGGSLKVEFEGDLAQWAK